MPTVPLYHRGFARQLPGQDQRPGDSGAAHCAAGRCRDATPAYTPQVPQRDRTPPHCAISSSLRYVRASESRRSPALVRGRLGAIVDCDVFRSWSATGADRAEGFQEMLLARHAALLAESTWRWAWMWRSTTCGRLPAWLPPEQLQDKARIRVVWLRAASAETTGATRSAALDVQGARVDELQGELDALDWPDSVIRLDTTGQSVEETLDAIEASSGDSPAGCRTGCRCGSRQRQKPGSWPPSMGGDLSAYRNHFREAWDWMMKRWRPLPRNFRNARTRSWRFTGTISGPVGEAA